MKAVIVDLLQGQAAALCDNGCVIKLNNANYTLGQIIDVHERKRNRSLWLRYISSVAAAAVLLVGGGGYAAYAMPYGVVSMDINPSIEYTINCFDYVLSVEGINEDGQTLLENIDSKLLINKPIRAALESSVDQLEAGEWLSADSQDILLSASTKRTSHSEKLLSDLEKDLFLGYDNVEIHSMAVSDPEDRGSHDGLSCGRRHILNELRDREGSSFNPDEWADKPIGDLLDRYENGTSSLDADAPTMMSSEFRRSDSLPEESSVSGKVHSEENSSFIGGDFHSDRSQVSTSGGSAEESENFDTSREAASAPYEQGFDPQKSDFNDTMAPPSEGEPAPADEEINSPSDEGEPAPFDFSSSIGNFAESESSKPAPDNAPFSGDGDGAGSSHGDSSPHGAPHH